MKLATGTAGKAAIVVGGSSVGGYSMYALATGGQSADSEGKQGEIDWARKITPEVQKRMKDFEAESEDYSKMSESFGYAFERFMLKPNENDSTWTELEKKVKEKADSTSGNPLSNEFKAVKNSNGKEGEKLKEICKEIYKKTKTTVTSSSNSQLLADTWQFCSVIGNKPESVREDNWDTNQNGKYKDKWVSLVGNSMALLNAQESGSEKKNDKAWKHIYEKILKVDKEAGDKKEKLDQKFKDINSGEDLSKECQKAYESTSSENASDYGNNVIDYCTLDASISLSQYPTKTEG